MTALMVNTVEVLRVRLLLPLHKFRPRRSGTFQQQVNVIRHQTIRINHDSVSLPIVRKPFQVDLIVLFLEKGFLSLVSPYNNVIKNTRSKQPGLSRHGIPIIGCNQSLSTYLTGMSLARKKGVAQR